jgi:hypothetical protein
MSRAICPALFMSKNLIQFISCINHKRRILVDFLSNPNPTGLIFVCYFLVVIILAVSCLPTIWRLMASWVTSSLKPFLHNAGMALSRAEVRRVSDSHPYHTGIRIAGLLR